MTGLPNNQPPDEKTLLSKIAEGDEKAFSELFSIYIPFLLPTIRKLVKDNGVADDIAQDVFMRIWLYRDKLSLVESPRSWILKVTYNRIFSYKADQEKKDTLTRNIAAGQKDISLETEEQLTYQSLKRLLSEALKQLPPQQRKIYLLSRTNDMSLREIAESLGISTQTVKNTLGKALQSVRNYIEHSGYPFFLFLIFLKFF